MEKKETMENKKVLMERNSEGKLGLFTTQLNSKNLWTGGKIKKWRKKASERKELVSTIEAMLDKKLKIQTKPVKKKSKKEEKMIDMSDMEESDETSIESSPEKEKYLEKKKKRKLQQKKKKSEKIEAFKDLQKRLEVIEKENSKLKSQMKTFSSKEKEENQTSGSEEEAEDSDAPSFREIEKEFEGKDGTKNLKLWAKENQIPYTKKAEMIMAVYATRIKTVSK